MAPELADHETRIRLLERQATEAAWEIAGLKLTVKEWTPMLESVEDQQKAQAKRDTDRKAALTNREKAIGAFLVFASPFVLLVAQHLLGWHT